MDVGACTVMILDFGGPQGSGMGPAIVAKRYGAELVNTPT